MDYPSTYVKIVGGKLDLSDAYAKGLGVFDLFSIRYAYSQFPPGANEEQELDNIVREAESANPPLLYINDADRAVKLLPGGRICDVAPTMLELLGIPKPAAMTGHSLIARG